MDDLEDLYEAIRWHLFQDLLVQQERESRRGETMNEDMPIYPVEDWRGSRDKGYVDTPYGRIWKSDDQEQAGSLESYTHRWHEVFSKKAASVEFGVPGGPIIRYTQGNSFVTIGDRSIDVSDIPAYISALQDIAATSDQRPLTGAQYWQAPADSGGVPVNNGGVYMTHAPSAGEQRKMMEDKYYGRRGRR